MKAVIVWLVFAIGSYLLSRFFKTAEKDDFENRPETVGRITREVDSEEGNVMFYVVFTTVKGELKEGKSIYYSSTKGKYQIGDSVMIKYIIKEKGRPIVSIIDDDLIPCRLAVVKAARNMKIASLVFLILALGSLILYVL